MDGKHLRRRPQSTAQRAADGQLVSVEVGQAAAYRERIRRGEQYLCPACEVPFLTVKAGAVKTTSCIRQASAPAGYLWAEMTAQHAQLEAITTA